MDKGKEVKKVQVAVLERKVIASSATNQKVYSEASEFAGLNKTYSQFISAAEAKKLTKRMANNLLENDRRIAGLESPRELIRWAFKAKKGEVSTVFEFGNNFVVATLTAIREEGNAPLEQVRDDVRIKVLREKKGQILADKMREALKGSNSLDEVAQKLNAKVEQASRISFSSFSIPSAGVEPAVIATASVSAEGRITGPIIGNNGVLQLTLPPSIRTKATWPPRGCAWPTRTSRGPTTRPSRRLKRTPTLKINGRNSTSSKPYQGSTIRVRA
jgi:peptidyl-prolyl cis-trans isomerase D